MVDGGINMTNKTLGILGGMGPLATAIFLEQIVTLTDASKDQEHIDTIVYNMPSIPDRTSFILGKNNNSPSQALQQHVKALVNQGVHCIAIPCNTAMHFYNDIKDLGTEVLNISKIALEATPQGKKIGILATSGTVSSGIFQTIAKELGRKLILPDEQYQNLLMDVIYTAIKSGDPVDEVSFTKITDHLRQKGSDAIILGCTELTIVNKQMKLDPNIYIDASVELAKRSITKMGYKVRT